VSIVTFAVGRTVWFLADRTNGRAYATVLRLSVCRL